MLRTARHLHEVDGDEAPLPRRRRGAQLRRQRQDPARGPLRRRVDPARRRRRGRRARLRALRLVPAPREPAQVRREGRADAARSSAPATRRRRSRGVLDAARRQVHGLRRRGAAPRIASPPSWPRARGRLVPRAGWSSGRARSARAASSATRATSEMQSTMNLKIKYRESFRPFAPCVLRERAHEVFDIAEAAESPYMLLVAPRAREVPRARSPTEQEQADEGSGPAQARERLPLRLPGHHPRRLLGPHPDGRRGAPRPLLPADEGVRAADGLRRSSSTRASTSAASPSSTRPSRRSTASSTRRWTSSSSRTPSSSRRSSRRSTTTGRGSRSSSWIDLGPGPASPTAPGWTRERPPG